jgi:squalene-hopene/tetraprenyl-beta-curcumene cyclase
LATVDPAQHRTLIDRGLRWIDENQDDDGGWGDTTDSPSNLSTTLLCYSALAARKSESAHSDCLDKARAWLASTVGSLEPQAVAAAVIQQYGKDRTFSVPILTMCALAGRLGDGPDAWRYVIPLPFELAVLPHRLFRWLHLPVVSYALPALIAIGQARYAHLRPGNPLARAVRALARSRTLDVLKTLQPDNGGFLEAAPLTSFVTMSLVASGHRDHEVVSKGVDFLAASIRDDGSWPIDTNLAMWGTTLSVAALSASDLDGSWPASERQQFRDWLLACQHTRVHPYTHAAPGGWAWTNLPGGVPDADDTAGALLALSRLGEDRDAAISAVCWGIEWLLGLQNRDGGIPTFCRGWTNLPFDKSSADITAHAVAAMAAWLDFLPNALIRQTDRALAAAIGFLDRSQRDDGAWVPLWFGNQHARDHENPVYGTARVLSHLAGVGEPYRARVRPICERAAIWLISVQNADGGWGGAAGVASSTEETALAVDALAEVLLRQKEVGSAPEMATAVGRGVDWLIHRTDWGRSMTASPIGLYFARLWYAEELYPLVFSLAALGKIARLVLQT